MYVHHLCSYAAPIEFQSSADHHENLIPVPEGSGAWNRQNKQAFNFKILHK